MILTPKKYREEKLLSECTRRSHDNILTHQSPYERSTTKKFDLGARWQMNDRVFYYGKAGGNLGNLEYPVINSHIIPDDGYEGAISGTPVVGDTTITITDTGSAATRPLNYYKDGYIHIYSSTVAQRQTRRVIGSTVGNGATITLTLDYPLTPDASGNLTVTTVDVYPNMFSEFMAPREVASGHETFVGFPQALLQSGEYGWIQTWGPVNGHYNQYFPGDSSGDLASDRDCYFTAYGEIVTLQQMGSFVGGSFQRAGYVIPCTKSNYGSVFINLQLSP